MSGTCACGAPIYHGKCANPALHAAYERQLKAQENGRKGGNTQAAKDALNKHRKPRQPGTPNH